MPRTNLDAGLKELRAQMDVGRTDVTTSSFASS